MSVGLDQERPGVSNPAVGSNAHLDRREDLLQFVDASIEMPLEDALVYVHPQYAAKIEKWTKYLNCYEADDIYRYIFRHSRESEDIFTQRVSRGYYYNYVASVVDLFVSYLYHAPITRELGSLAGEDLDALYKDANRAGDTFHIFIQTIATFAQVVGHCGVLVDAPKMPEDGFQSEEARKRAGFRPHLVCIQASQILDWSVDEDNNFNWVKIEVAPPETRSFDRPVDEDSRFFLVWSKDAWVLYVLDGDGARVDSAGENSLGEVPLVIIRGERSLTHSWMGLSTVRDISDINIAILNWASLGDEEIYERCLNVLAIEKGEGDAPVTLSHHNVLEFEPGATAPFYLTPGQSPLEMITKWTDRGKEEIYRLAKLGGSTGLMGVREATSGIAYAYEFNETNQSLAKKAESLEQGEIEIHRLIGKWMGKEFDGNISYPREFGVEDFVHEIQVLAEARTQVSSTTAIKRIEEKLLMKMFSRENQQLRDLIISEIEAGPPLPTGVLETFYTVPGALVGPEEQPSGETDGSTSGGEAETEE